jgi:hypothetical protein
MASSKKNKKNKVNASKMFQMLPNRFGSHRFKADASRPAFQRLSL